MEKNPLANAIKLTFLSELPTEGTLIGHRFQDTAHRTWIIVATRPSLNGDMAEVDAELMGDRGVPLRPPAPSSPPPANRMRTAGPGGVS